MPTLTARISAKYQVVLPKTVREALKLRPDDRLEFLIDGDTVTIRPQPAQNQPAPATPGVQREVWPAPDPWVDEQRKWDQRASCPISRLGRRHRTTTQPPATTLLCGSITHTSRRPRHPRPAPVTLATGTFELTSYLDEYELPFALTESASIEIELRITNALYLPERGEDRNATLTGPRRQLRR